MPAKWPSLLQVLSDEFGSRGAMLLASTNDGLRGLESPWLTDVRDQYIGGGWDKDTTRFDWIAADQYPGFRTDLDFVSPDEMAAIPLYAEFLIPHGFDAGAATLVPGAGGDMLLLSLEAFSDHDASRAAVPRLDRLRPHLARGAMLAAQMRLEQARAAVAALDLIGAGAAMIAPSGTIRAANTRFETMAFATTGASDQIRLFDRANDQRLREALDQINAGGNGASIPMRTGAHIIALHVLPVRGVACDLFADCAAILVAATAGVAASADESLIRHLYDLTPAEARVATAIGRGEKVDRIALESGIAIGTVRNHLKSVFLKSGVSSQTELALLLADFVRPLALS